MISIEELKKLSKSKLAIRLLKMERKNAKLENTIMMMKIRDLDHIENDDQVIERKVKLDRSDLNKGNDLKVYPRPRYPQW